MRHIDKKHFTKAERIVARLLQEHHIPFRSKVKIGGEEVDFLIGTLAIEINGHAQNGEKNARLAAQGYVPLHFTNKEVRENRLHILNLITQCH